MQFDYTTVTEIPGNKVTEEAVEMMSTRYAFAANHSAGKDMLEVACGAGQGLGYMKSVATSIVGGDFEFNLVKLARKHYEARVNLTQFDAHHLPFKNNSFDTVILFEALYYLSDPVQFVKEANRVLRRNGVILICTVNKDWSDFNPSPRSTTYHSGIDLFKLLEKQGFNVELYGAFPTKVDRFSGKIVSLIKQIAVTLHLIPNSMKGKEWLKRIFYGKLIPLPAELDCSETDFLKLKPIPTRTNTSAYKVLYAVAHID